MARPPPVGRHRLLALSFALLTAQLALPAQAAPAAGPPTNEVATLIDRLAIRGLLQGRYDYVEKGTTVTGVRVPQKNSFSVGKARLQLDGSVHERVDFRLYFDLWYRGQGLQLLEARITFWLDKPGAQLFVGQFQPATLGEGVPTFWQFIAPGRAGETMIVGLPDRGLGLRGRLFGKRLLYELRLTNGNGIGSERRGGNDNVALRAGGLIKLEPLGKLPLFQDDLDRGDWRFGLGFSVFSSRDADDLVHHQDKIWWGANTILRGHGLYVKAILGRLDVEQDRGSSRDQIYGSLQAGYAIPIWFDHVVEPVARFTFLDADRNAADAEEQTTTVGFNYFVAGRRAKLQLNYVHKREAAFELDNDTLQAAATLVY